MASYVTFELEDGTIVYVESIEAPKGSSGLIPAGRGAEQAADQAAVSFEKSVSGVRKMAAEMLKQFKEGFTEQPDEVSISFGLKASGELGTLLVARGGMEANYNVSMRWHKEHKEDEDEDEKDEKKDKKEEK